jgi:hypothetical protein
MVGLFQEWQRITSMKGSNYRRAIASEVRKVTGVLIF